MSSADAAELLIELVRTPSPSGAEGAVARVLADWALAHDLAVTVDDCAVRIEVPGRTPGPTLLFASHLDTVPPGDGWSVDPYAGVVDDGRLIARGAVDAKASVAAMVTAATALHAAGGPPAGRLMVLATYSEETRDTTMPEALRRMEAPPDAAVVGEPTSLEPCVAQRGQLLVELEWEGEQVHAGWAADRDRPPVNAIHRAVQDLSIIKEMHFERIHPLLGGVAITPTLLEAGVARNVTPPRCTAMLDIRTTPAYEHGEIVDALRRRLQARVTVYSDRLVPAATPDGSRLLTAFERARPAARPFVSPTCSDWVFLRHLDALKLGPGSSRSSHTADESIALAEVSAGAELYRDVAVEYLR